MTGLRGFIRDGIEENSGKIRNKVGCFTPYPHDRLFIDDNAVTEFSTILFSEFWGIYAFRN